MKVSKLVMVLLVMIFATTSVFAGKGKGRGRVNRGRVNPNKGLTTVKNKQLNKVVQQAKKGKVVYSKAIRDMANVLGTKAKTTKAALNVLESRFPVAKQRIRELVETEIIKAPAGAKKELIKKFVAGKMKLLARKIAVDRAGLALSSYLTAFSGIANLKVLNDNIAAGTLAKFVSVHEELVKHVEARPLGITVGDAIISFLVLKKAMTLDPALVISKNVLKNASRETLITAREWAEEVAKRCNII